MFLQVSKTSRINLNNLVTWSVMGDGDILLEIDLSNSEVGMDEMLDGVEFHEEPDSFTITDEFAKYDRLLEWLNSNTL